MKDRRYDDRLIAIMFKIKKRINNLITSQNIRVRTNNRGLMLEEFIFFLNYFKGFKIYEMPQHIEFIDIIKSYIRLHGKYTDGLKTSLIKIIDEENISLKEIIKEKEKYNIS